MNHRSEKWKRPISSCCLSPGQCRLFPAALFAVFQLPPFLPLGKRSAGEQLTHSGSLDVVLESTDLQHWPQLIECTLTPSRVSKCVLQTKVKCVVQQQQGDATPHWCLVMGTAGTSWRSPAQDGKRWKRAAPLGAEQSLHPNSPALYAVTQLSTASKQCEGTSASYSIPHPPCKWILCKQMTRNNLEASQFLARTDACQHCCTNRT